MGHHRTTWEFQALHFALVISLQGSVVSRIFPIIFQDIPNYISNKGGVALIHSTNPLKHNTAVCLIVGGINDVIVFLNHYSSEYFTQNSSLQFILERRIKRFFGATRVFGVCGMWRYICSVICDDRKRNGNAKLCNYIKLCLSFGPLF